MFKFRNFMMVMVLAVFASGMSGCASMGAVGTGLATMSDSVVNKWKEVTTDNELDDYCNKLAGVINAHAKEENAVLAPKVARKAMFVGKTIVEFVDFEILKLNDPKKFNEAIEAIDNYVKHGDSRFRVKLAENSLENEVLEIWKTYLHAQLINLAEGNEVDYTPAKTAKKKAEEAKKQEKMANKN